MSVPIRLPIKIRKVSRLRSPDGGVQLPGDVGQLVPAEVVVADGEVPGAQTFGGVLDAAYAAGQTAVDEQDDEANDDEGHGGDDDEKKHEVVDADPYYIRAFPSR